MGDVKKCKCGKEIKFIKINKTGKFMPCETELTILVEPSEKFYLVTTTGEVLLTDEPDSVGYEPHWVNCPFSSEFRNKVKEKRNERNRCREN